MSRSCWPGQAARRRRWRGTGAAFPYLVTVCWDGVAPETPLVVVQTRDQREMRVLAVDPATGATSVVRADTDPHWLEIVPACPPGPPAAGSSGPWTQAGRGGCSWPRPPT